MENGMLYIVFSGTPCKMGSFIRAVTHGCYNHVSVALDPRLSEIYSFARLHRKTPLCGGFVRESAERFRYGDLIAETAICAVPVADAEAVRERIRDMENSDGKYIYNMLSAVCVPLRRRINVRDSYTCVEFVVDMLSVGGFSIERRYYSIPELYALLRPYEIYCGEYPSEGTVIDCGFDDDVPVRRRVTRTTRQLWRLIVRFVYRPTHNKHK